MTQSAMSEAVDQVPTTEALLSDVTVQAALERAWADSEVDDRLKRHEEGGWIYVNTNTRELLVRRAAAGRRSAIDLSDPPLVPGAVVVATFHTHPNPSSEGWNSGPSTSDTESAFVLGVPCLIRADDGIHVTGPDRRRGGLGGSAGFPD
jgi:hypothetical protein